MNKSYFLPLVLATAVTSVAFAYDDVYTNVFTGVTSVTSPGGVPTAVGGEWTTTGVVLTNVDNAVGFESEGAAVLKLTVTETPQDQNTIFRVTVTGTVEEVETLLTPGVDVQTAFAVCTNESNVSHFWAWNGGTWCELDAVGDFDGSTPTNLTVEISYQGGATRKVRFALGEQYLNGGNWTNLVAGAALENNNLNAVGVNGSGTLVAVNGEVMLGVAEYNGVKYGTLTEAVAKAEAVAAENPEIAPTPIDVLRETTETVAVTGDGVVIADHGKMSDATVTVPENKKIAIQPTDAEIASTDLKGASGEYTFSVNVTGTTNIEVRLPESMLAHKEIVPGSVGVSGNIVTAIVQTATSVLENAKPDGEKALVANETKLRKFLSDYKADTYNAAGVSKESIEAALKDTGANGIALYQSYALGIAPTVSVKPVTVANDVADDGVTLSIPALVSPTLSGDYTPKYKVWNADTNIEYSVASEIKVPLKTGSYTVDIVFENPVSE